jgi:AAA family ATP:ADP antiporter
MAQTKKEFGRWRSLLWPIHNFELKKLIPMVILFFLILFNYTVLRDTKDTLIVTAPGGGAEVIPFLKFWGVLPCAVFFMLIYAKLSNKLSKPALFYSMISPFIIFFALFATVLYPCRDLIHPTHLADKLQAVLPIGMNGLVAMFRNWTYSLFYVMAELWGSVGISLLFWGFANDTTKISESKRFYALFGLFANFALIISGQLIRWATAIRANLSAGADPWQISLNYLMSMVALAGILILGIYWWINRYVLTDARFYNLDEQKKQKANKPKLSMKESLFYLIRSKYLGCIAILVISYGMAINLIEVIWKNQLKLQYPDPNAYGHFMGGFSQFTGIFTIFMMLFVGGNVIRRLGWKKAALFTPLVLLVTGVGFFSFIIFRDNLTGAIASIGTSPLMLAVIFGTIQNIFSKASKYSLFDPSKEMSYIPLDQEQKVKGKAAVDVVAARFGKAGGSLMQQGLIVGLGGIAFITPYAAGIVLGILAIWMLAVHSLNKQFLKLTSFKQETAAEEGEKREEIEPVSKVSAQAETT